MAQAWSEILAQIAARRGVLGDAWLEMLAGVPDVEPQTLRVIVVDIADRIIANVSPDNWRPEAIQEAGAITSALVHGDSRVLVRCHHILYEHLAAPLAVPDRDRFAPQLIAMIAEFSGGFVRTVSQEPRSHAIAEVASNYPDNVGYEAQRNEAWVRLIVNHVPLIVVAVDALLTITHIEGLALKTIGLDPRRVVGSTIEDIFQNLLPGEAPPIFDHFRTALRGEQIAVVGTAAGTVFKTLYAPLVAFDGTLVGAVAVALDITEQTTTNAALARSYQSMTERVEAERLHLAHELHDDSLQRLLAVSYQLGLMARNIGHQEPAERTPDKMMLNRIEIARQEVLNVVRQLRVLIGDLRPPALDVFGLPAALETYVERLRRTHADQRPSFVLELDVADQMLPKTTALCFFRVAQECVRNALKYADAAQIYLSFSTQAEMAVLTVRDDGKGFQLPATLSQLTQQDHYGLVGLTERVEWNGGVLSISSEPGHGTEVVARIPLYGAERGVV